MLTFVYTTEVLEHVVVVAELLTLVDASTVSSFSSRSWFSFGGRNDESSVSADESGNDRLCRSRLERLSDGSIGGRLLHELKSVLQDRICCSE